MEVMGHLWLPIMRSQTHPINNNAIHALWMSKYSFRNMVSNGRSNIMDPEFFTRIHFQGHPSLPLKTAMESREPTYRNFQTPVCNRRRFSRINDVGGAILFVDDTTNFLTHKHRISKNIYLMYSKTIRQTYQCLTSNFYFHKQKFMRL